VRQHTVLAAVALAGGCYGVLTTIYILLFGMTRLTPWGLVHHIPVFISKRKNHVKDGMYIEESGYDQTNNNTHSGQPIQSEDNNSKAAPNKSKLSSTILVPWFFRSRIRGDKTYTTNGKNDTFMRNMITRKELEGDKKEAHQLETLKTGNHANDTSMYSPELRLLNSKDRRKNSLSSSNSSNSLNEQYVSTPIPQAANSPPVLPPHYTMPMAGNSGSSSSHHYNNLSSLDNISNLLRFEQERSSALEVRSTELSNRVEELEVILSEYFINTDYLDQLRARRNSKLIPASDRNNL
jgi:hypothetical protein